MTPEDIADLVWSDSPAVSPDGAQLAYVVRGIDADANEYRSQIWTVPADGSARPRPLTSGQDREGAPCWTPDGTAIAFTARLTDGGSGDEPVQSIQLLPFERPGQAAILVKGPEGFEGLTFSPDGRWLAYVTRTRGDGYEAASDKERPPRKVERLLPIFNGEGFISDRPSHVYVVPTNASAGPRNLTPGPVAVSQPSWFPDSSRVAVHVDPMTVDLLTHTAVVPVDGGELVALTVGGFYSRPAVSLDGARVAVLGFDDPLVFPQNAHVGLVDGSEGQQPRWITTDLDRTWAPLPGERTPVWVGDDELLTAVEDRGNTHLYSIGPDRSPELVVGGERMVVSWDAAGGTIAFAASDPETPAEIFTMTGGVERQLTDHTDAFRARVSPRPAERFTASSGHGPDAVEVDSWLLTPHGFDPDRTYPALLNIHGGPFTQYGNTFFDEAQLWCGAGYVVVMSNPRGASGRQNEWGKAILGPKHPIEAGTGWGSVDFDDIMAVTDTVIERYPFIDPEHIGVIGGSYGGYMTSWAVTHTDRFAAACSERAANNLLSLEYGSDAAGYFRSEVGPNFFEDPQEYLRMSPITYVEKLDTPLLILHSENDLRCPIDQANQLFVACQLLGKSDVEFYRFPGEDHDLSRSGSPTHRRQRAELIIEFFNRYLQSG